MTLRVKEGCILCRGKQADPELRRVQVWENNLWRLTISLEAEVLGFAYLEPKRHIPAITDLSGEEASTFGDVLATISRVLIEVTQAEQIYLYVFGGGLDHLHIHLAPHRTGDALNNRMIRGELQEEVLPEGGTRIISQEYPPLPEREHFKVADLVEQRLSTALQA